MKLIGIDKDNIRKEILELVGESSIFICDRNILPKEEFVENKIDEEIMQDGEEDYCGIEFKHTVNINVILGTYETGMYMDISVNNNNLVHEVRQSKLISDYVLLSIKENTEEPKYVVVGDYEE